MILKRKIAHLAHRRALRTLIIASAEKLKSLFLQATFSQTVCIWTIHVPNDNNDTIVIPTISATHRNYSEKCYTCKQQKPILVEMIDFTVTQVDNFCKNELITVMFKFLVEKTQALFFQTKTIFEYVCLNVQLYPCSND